MNNSRRKEIAKAQALIAEAKEIIENCASKEQDYYDNMPEAFQSSEKGEKAQEDADTLYVVFGQLDEAECILSTILGE